MIDWLRRDALEPRVVLRCVGAADRGRVPGERRARERVDLMDLDGHLREPAAERDAWQRTTGGMTGVPRLETEPETELLSHDPGALALTMPNAWARGTSRSVPGSKES